MQPKISPLVLSVVIPTLGRSELLETIEQLLTLPLDGHEFEVIVGGNGTESHDLLEEIEARFSSSIQNLQICKFDEFVATAEENAYRAMRLAVGNHIWLLGDDDLLLRNGLIEICSFAKSNFAGVFFNYRQMTSNAQILPNAPFMSSGMSRSLSFADLVSRLGIQSVPTGFGRFLIRRDLVDFDLWQQIIKESGALFSHVLAFAFFLQDEEIIWSNTPVLIYRQSSYHEGSNATWKNYGKLRNEPWMTPFCGQLAGQIRFLVENGVWSKHQAEFSMFNERENTIYQADYLLQQMSMQLREALLDSNENFRDLDLDNLTWFYLFIAPSRLPAFRRLESLSRALSSPASGGKKFDLEEIEKTFPHNSQDGLFSGGIACWLDGYPVFGVPYGLVQIRASVIERPLIMRIFDLDLLKTGDNFTFFGGSEDLILHVNNSKDVYQNSLHYKERSSWNIATGVAEFQSIPRIYAWPSLTLMRLVRRAPIFIRKYVKKFLV